jgi:chromatin structure-remodeling complex protein RSC7
VLGGTKTGNGAWGLAWVDVVMEMLPTGGEDGAGEEREALLRAVEGT